MCGISGAGFFEQFLSAPLYGTSGKMHQQRNFLIVMPVTEVSEQLDISFVQRAGMAVDIGYEGFGQAEGIDERPGDGIVEVVAFGLNPLQGSHQFLRGRIFDEVSINALSDHIHNEVLFFHHGENNDFYLRVILFKKIQGLHAVCTSEDLDICFAPDGPMEAILTARDKGLVGPIGITGHGWSSPLTHLEALERFPFATVMTSCNRMMFERPLFRSSWFALLDHCQQQDVGIQVLKATAKGPWGDRTPTHNTWYEPFTAQADVDRAIAWLLAQPVTTLCSAGDATLLPGICDAAERWRTVDPATADALLADPAYADFFDAA